MADGGICIRQKRHSKNDDKEYPEGYDPEMIKVRCLNCGEDSYIGPRPPGAKAKREAGYEMPKIGTFIDMVCDSCRKPLLKMPWYRNKMGRLESYVIVCDNTNCDRFRNPVGYERVE